MELETVRQWDWACCNFCVLWKKLMMQNQSIGMNIDICSDQFSMLGPIFIFRLIPSQAILPQRLQSLTFGHEFNQPLRHVNFPATLRSMTGRWCCGGGPESNGRGLIWARASNGFQWLPMGSNLDTAHRTFGGCFNQSLVGVPWWKTWEKLELHATWRMCTSKAYGDMYTHVNTWHMI